MKSGEVGDVRGDERGATRHEATQDYGGALDMLRLALLDVVADRATFEQLRAPIRRLCVFAHSEEVRAEELLVRFKEIWASLPPLAGLPRGRQRSELMARVATMCIEEFYGPPARDGAPHDS